MKLARFLGSEIVILFVEGPFTYGVRGDMLPSSAAVKFFETHRRAARTALLRLGRQVRRRGVRCRLVFARGVAPYTIAHTARRLRAGMVVMATHGRTGLRALVMGSVAEKVLRLASCPVITVRPARPARREVLSSS